MLTCTYCGFNSDVRSGPAADVCPKCGRTLSATHASASFTWVDVARVSNLAEAGFLSDELIGFNIDARVHQAEDFSELHGGWKTHYLIRVPAEFAQQAATRIRSHAAESAAEAEAEGGNDFAEFSPSDPANWRPIVLVVLAGVASFVLGRQTAVPPVEPLPAPDSLAAAVGAVGRPFVTDAGNGSPRHRLLFDRPRRIWQLDIDANGDGVFDSRRQFSPTGDAR
jgi:hypothetical protein